MTRLHLVRHGQALAGWDADPDPGLSDLGRSQAVHVAADLAGSLDPRPVLVSPLRRTRETAVPLCDTWEVAASIEPAVGEIPSPVPDLAGSLDPRPVLVSPLRRTRETAEPLCEAWAVAPVIDPSVGEIPSPLDDLAARGEWLDGALRARFAELDDAVRAWRDALLVTLRSLTSDTVVVTHFVAINAVVGAALGVDAVTTFLPANTSVTKIEIDAGTGAITVIARGAEAPPIVG